MNYEMPDTEDIRVSRRTVAFGTSLALACVVNALLVVAKEKSSAIMSALQKLTGHHWISHALIVLAVFVGPGWALGFGRAPGRAAPVIRTVVAGVAVGGAIIFGFYLTEVF